MHDEPITKSQPNFHIFNLYCFLNHAGYNDENNKAGMHPVRGSVRNVLENNKRLQNTNIYKDFFNKCYIHNKVHLYHFNKYALALSTNSSFTLKYENYSTKLLPNFNKVLMDFSEEADTNNLWENYLAEHQTISDKYNLIIQKIIQQTKTCFRTYKNENNNILVIPNLLESYYRNKSVQIENNIYIVIGPYKNDEPHIEGIIHEYIHTIVNPIIDKLKDKIEKHTKLFDNVPKNPQIIGSYNNWRTYFNECLVRSLAITVHAEIDSRQKQSIENAKNNLIENGFTLTNDFINLLNREPFPLDLETTLNSYLEELD